jgi:aldehyde dehydrogenase (NAD+)
MPSIGEAVNFINSREKPLALYYFGNNKKNKDELIHCTSSGGVCVNDCCFHAVNPHLPFGGVGNSGMGKLYGKWGFESFTNAKAVLERGTNNAWPLSVRFPPYDDSKKRTFAFVSKLLFFTQDQAKHTIMIMVALLALYIYWCYFS